MRHLTLLLATALALPATAGVVSRDLFEPGDGLLTYDEVNQREWLDFEATRQMTLLEVLNSFYYLSRDQGFRFAESQDIADLARSTSIQAVDWRAPDETLAGSRLLAVLSNDFPTLPFVADDYEAQDGLLLMSGRYPDGISYRGYDNATMVVRSNNPFALLLAYLQYSIDESFGRPDPSEFMFPTAGEQPFYWLYRDAIPVPEPAAGWLALAACFAALRLRALA